MLVYMDSLRSYLDRADRSFGDTVERAERSHHRRRLRRIGWERALDAAPGFDAPGARRRPGNDVEILVDGAEALPLIAGALRSARRRVLLAGWFFSAGFELERGNGSVPLRELLREVAGHADVHVLAWAGAPVPVFKPTRKAVAAELASLACHPRIAVAADSHERPLHCHHEKLVVIDDERAFVGGIDLTDLAGDRYDVPGHPTRGRLGWHDAASLLRGPAVADVARHFCTRWEAVTREPLAPAEPQAAAGAIDVSVVRTVPERVYDAVRGGEFTILEAYAGALRAARRLVYLENQFLWSSEIVQILAEKLREPPTDEFRVVVVLPSRPNNGADDTRGQLGVLVEADAGQGRFLACTLYAPAPRPANVYVHAKIGIVDDEWLTVGSANLNEHSLFNDTEMNVVVHDAGTAAATRRRLWAEHLGLSLDEVSGDPCRLVDEVWRPIAEEQRQKLEARAPLTRPLAELANVSRRSARLYGPVQSLLVDG
jgi:phosphatidylserine/phosphatidylglycerophosphate/cardiolipin synthase-like enzyme